MSIQIQYLGYYGYHLTMGNGDSVLIDPNISHHDRLLTGIQPTQILLTHAHPDWRDSVALANATGAVLYAPEGCQLATVNTLPATQRQPLSADHSLAFRWGELVILESPSDPDSDVPDTACVSLMIQSEGNNILFAGQSPPGPHIRAYGRDFKPNASFLPAQRFPGERVVQAAMWLGSDLVFPMNVEPGDDPDTNDAFFSEIYAALDYHTPAICRILQPGDTYTLVPTESTGRVAGPEARY
ncbi:MAG: MBL fold metallo-hydrolase [Candidatus Melainabacteria bacterium]